MTQIVECVPNFSEGKDIGIIDAIASAIRETKGCSLLEGHLACVVHPFLYDLCVVPHKL